MLNKPIKKKPFGYCFLGGLCHNLKHEVMWSESNINFAVRQ